MTKDQRIAQLESQLAEMIAVVQDAIIGLDQAYDCVCKEFNDEVLLHIGIRRARLQTALDKLNN